MTQSAGDAGSLLHPPAPANWLRKYARGNVSFLPPAAGLPVFRGFAEWDCYATNLDVMIDFSGADYPPGGAFVIVRSYVQDSVGAGRVILGSYQVIPGVGVTPDGLSVAGATYCVQPGGIFSNQFLFHSGGRAAVVWGIEMAGVGFTLGPVVSNLVVVGIAHGREVGVPFPS